MDYIQTGFWVAAILFWVNTGVYLARIMFFLARHRTDPWYSLLFGFAVWRRVLTNDLSGFDPPQQDEFQSLRRVAMLSLCMSIVCLVLPGFLHALI